MIKIVAFAALAACVLAQAPPFLEKEFLASAAKQAEFGQLIQSGAGLNDAQMDAKVKAWIANQDPSIKSAFAAFQQQVEQARKQGEALHQAALARFSPAAKAADAKLSAIANNNGLSQEQKGQQIDQLMNSLPANVRNEIQQAMQG